MPMLRVDEPESVLLRTISREKIGIQLPKALTPVLKVKQNSTKLIHSTKNLWSPENFEVEINIHAKKLGMHGLLRRKTVREQFLRHS